MSDIPSDIFRKILLQLPAESLFRFRSVCKAWRRIIDDPSFIKSHANNQHSSATLRIRNTEGSPIYYLSLDSLNYADGNQIIDAYRVKTLIYTDVPRMPTLPVASCNGLILISHYDIKKIWVIWNPLTREFHELPELNIDVRLMGSGLGYDFIADDYKVVRIDEVVRIDALFSREKIVYRTLVYSLKMDDWKTIKDCPCVLCDFPCSIYLNGALHWRSWEMIIALDLGTEDYRQLPFPPTQKGPKEPFQMHLDALDGCLVLSCYYMIERLDGWIMKDYGVGKSWMKLFSFGKLDIIGAMGTLRRIAYLKSEGQVILQHDSNFFWLDIEKNTTKKLTIDGLPNHFTSQICPGSLFRLDDSCDDSRNVAEKTTA